MERDEFVGNISVLSRFPQYLFTIRDESSCATTTYLIHAILTGAEVVAWNMGILWNGIAGKRI